MSTYNICENHWIYKHDLQYFQSFVPDTPGDANGKGKNANFRSFFCEVRLRKYVSKSYCVKTTHPLHSKLRTHIEYLML